MSRLFAKYRPLAVTIRIESAISTAAGGQYAAFFDPNPKNDWLSVDAVSALTSMPVQDTGASWECLKLVVPPAELAKFDELYTEDNTLEVLKTRFGQFVLMTLVAPTVTGPSEVTVWLDVHWEFHEPNASAEFSQAPLVFPAGNWTVSAAGAITHPGSFAIPPRCVLKLYPELPGTMVASGAATPWIAAFAAQQPAYVFATQAGAINFAQFGDLSGKEIAGTAPSQALPEMVGTFEQRFVSLGNRLPYLANP